MKTFLVLFISILSVVTASPEPEKKVFCLHGKWAHYRKGNGNFGIDQMDPLLCSHLVYSYFGIDAEANIVVRDTWLDLEENYGLGNLKKLSKLKKINPSLKTIAAVGGWSEGSQTFSSIANDARKRKMFVKNTLEFLEKYNFDGLHLDWEYPGHREGSQTSDKEAFTLLVKDLAKGLQFSGYILTALVAPEHYTADRAYDIPQISKYLDYILLKTLDMHGSWGSKIGNNSPLYPASNEQNLERLLNINTGVFYWLERGAPSEKLIVGIPTFGRGFKMISEDQNTPGSPHLGPSEEGPYSTDPGFMGFNELCEKRLTEDWEDFWDDEQLVPYSTSGDQWLGYDNEESFRIKARYVRSYKLGGVMFAHMETDDFKGFCGRGTFPLLKEINRTLKEKSPNDHHKNKKVCVNTMRYS